MKVPNKIILVMAFILQPFMTYGKIFSCRHFLATEIEQQDLSNTQRFTAYLSQLLNEGAVTTDSIKKIAEEIKLYGKMLSNPVSHQLIKGQTVFTNSIHEIHYTNLAVYLNRPDLDQQKILNWALQTLRTHQQTKSQKQEAETKTKVSTTEMKFHRVSKGEFWMGEDDERWKLKKVFVELTHDFEVMSTPVTQWMWVSEMKKNPSQFYVGLNSVQMKFDSINIRLQPDNPVEMVTWYSAAMFANHMSRKHKLPEVYNFSDVKFKEGTSMEDGTLDVTSGEVTINGPNIYETEGYRLPTEAESEFLLSDRGRTNTKYFTGVTEQNIGDYAWVHINSGKRTHPVAEKLPLKIDGKNFYDLIGNVWEWTSNKRQEGVEQLQDGKDPVGIKEGSYREMRGAGHSNHNEALYRSCRYRIQPESRFSSIGFRLVRTVK